MEWLLITLITTPLCILLLISAAVLPWINMARLNKLQKEIRALKGEQPAEATTPAPVPIQEEKKPETKASTPWTEPAKPVAAKSTPVPSVKAKPKESTWRENFIQHLSVRYPVWIGGLALALAGLFLVKYSIDHNLLSPTVRIFSGALLGAALLVSADYARKREIANARRIGQALSGAGIAVLYIVGFAASELYHLIPPMMGFLALGVTTGLAVILSVRHGAPIAIMGMLGGFMAPALISSNEPNALLLFVYLYAVFTGLMIVIQKKRWWALSLPTLLGAFIWVIAWLGSHHYTPDDSIWLGLFLIGMSATIIRTTHAQLGSENESRLFPRLTFTSVVNYLGLAGALTLMAITAGEGGFEPMNWVLFGLLAAGSIAMAYFQPKVYRTLPLAALAVVYTMLFAWTPYNNTEFLIIMLSFAGLFTISGYVLMWRSQYPVIWGLQLAASLLGFFMQAYLQLEWLDHMPIAMFWGATALVLAAALSYVLQMIRTHEAFDEKTRKVLLGIFATVGTSMVTLALAIEVKGEFFSVAVATQLLAMCWIQSKLELPAMRRLAGIMLLGFGFLLMPQIILLFQLSAYSLVEVELHLQQGVPIVDWPMFQLGLPAVMFTLASILLRQEKDSRLVQTLELAVIALIGTMGYYLMRHAFHVDADVLFKKAGYIERGSITAALFAMGLGCMAIGRVYTRKAVFYGGYLLGGVAIFRTVYFDLLSYNPLWVSQDVGELFLFNGLLLNVLLPAGLIYRFRSELVMADKTRFIKWCNVLMFILGFAWLNFTLRHAFHGNAMDEYGMGELETYSYSILWLVFGLMMMFIGAWKERKDFHHAALLVLMMTVGKVFLYDASELEGLYRVFSFLGLGLSLIGISYFFSRFVYRAND